MARNNNNKNAPAERGVRVDARRAAPSASGRSKAVRDPSQFHANGARERRAPSANGQRPNSTRLPANRQQNNPPSRAGNQQSTTGKALVKRGPTEIVEKKSYRAKREERMLDRVKKETALEIQRDAEEKIRSKGVIRTRSSLDRPFLILVLVLITLGTIAVISASYPTAIHEGKNPMHYVFQQGVYLAFGSAGMLICAALPYTFYKKAAPALFVIAFLLLAAVIPFGVVINGAKRWIPVVAGFTIQPSEFMKPALILILAWYFDKFRDKVTDRVHLFKRTFLMGVVIPLLIILVGVALIVWENHLSATLIIGAIGVSVMIIGGSHCVMTIITTVTAAVSGSLAYLFTHDYAMKRVVEKFAEEGDKYGASWQSEKGVLAIGSGGLLGLGIGAGRLKYSYVSEAFNDFIFTIWCEETGFVGAVIVIALFVALLWRGFKIAMHAPDNFSALVVYGIMVHIGIQTFLNLLVVTNISFNTGVSLPFFSYGGSALITQMAEMGIVMSISKHSYQTH